MHRRVAAAIAVGVTCLLSSAVFAQEQWVRGNVTAVSDTSITVSVKGKDMTFAITGDTRVIAPGGGTAQRQAEAAGKGGVKPSAVIKTGTGAEVHYVMKGGAMQATEVRGGVSGGSSSSRETGRSAMGEVTAVSATEISIKYGGGVHAFAVDGTTEVIATGGSTLAREKKAEGQGVRITDIVRMGDRVTVLYHEAGGKAHASQVRVRDRLTK
jgi:hypothetical protein